MGVVGLAVLAGVVYALPGVRSDATAGATADSQTTATISTLPKRGLGKSGLPLPRFVSLKTDRVNVRRGPSNEHDVSWVFTRKELPVEIIAADPPLDLPPVKQSLVVNALSGGTGEWGVGRAGMGYRDLIPDRQGGRFIASHIRIPDGGPVPDMVHFHKVRFQMIYCYRGWVDLLYEDQGPLFRMAAGDCVLQPPEIRHRVVESSAGLEVIEIGCPADHMTCIDHDLDLPNAELRPERDFGGQRFVRHRLDAATWRPWRFDGIETRDIGIAAATDGLAGAQVLRFGGTEQMPKHSHEAEFVFTFVLEGSATLEVEGFRA